MLSPGRKYNALAVSIVPPPTLNMRQPAHILISYQCPGLFNADSAQMPYHEFGCTKHNIAGNEDAINNKLPLKNKTKRLNIFAPS